MANRSLGFNEVKQLVAISSQKAASIDARSLWPGRDNTRLLAQAVKDRLPFVIFGDRRFRIRYTTHFGGSVFISPDDNGFVPCGYFTIHKLMGVLTAIEGLEEFVD